VKSEFLITLHQGDNPMSLFQSLVSPFARGSSAPTASPAKLESVPSLHPLDEIKEAADAFGLVVHLPGVAKEDLEITAEDDVLRIVGRRGWKCPESWIPLYRESTDVPSELVLRHDHALALERVRAELKDGVLRVSLPKTEAVKPRKIAVA